MKDKELVAQATHELKYGSYHNDAERSVMEAVIACDGDTEDEALQAALEAAYGHLPGGRSNRYISLLALLAPFPYGRPDEKKESSIANYFGKRKYVNPVKRTKITRERQETGPKFDDLSTNKSDLTITVKASKRKKSNEEIAPTFDDIGWE